MIDKYHCDNCDVSLLSGFLESMLRFDPGHRLRATKQSLGHAPRAGQYDPQIIARFKIASDELEEDTTVQIVAKRLVWACRFRKLLDQECVALEKSVGLMAG